MRLYEPIKILSDNFRGPFGFLCTETNFLEVPDLRCRGLDAWDILRHYGTAEVVVVRVGVTILLIVTCGTDFELPDY
jgi:hypothetical protein